MPLIVNLGFLCQNSLKSSIGVIPWRNSRSGVVEVVATRSTTADDLKLWVGSQSHKCGVFLCDKFI